MKKDMIFLLCYVHTLGLPVLLTAEEEAVLCGSAILAAAASGLKVNSQGAMMGGVAKGEGQSFLRGQRGEEEILNKGGEREKNKWMGRMRKSGKLVKSITVERTVCC